MSNSQWLRLIRQQLDIYTSNSSNVIYVCQRVTILRKDLLKDRYAAQMVSLKKKIYIYIKSPESDLSTIKMIPECLVLD